MISGHRHKDGQASQTDFFCHSVHMKKMFCCLGPFKTSFVLFAMLPGTEIERERKQNSLRQEENEKARSETQNLAPVQSLHFIPPGL